MKPLINICAALAILSVGANFAEAQDKKATPKKAKRAKRAKKTSGPMAVVEDVVGLPRVLLIGDSISIGYTIPVRTKLEGKANIHRPSTNCGPTTRGVENIDNWLGNGKWDVIHFNWGLHDLKYMGPNGKNLADPKGKKTSQQVPPVEYEKNLRILVKRMKKTGASLIWRSTTPVPKGAGGRVVGDSAKYNTIAAKIMKEEGIPTNDLYAVSMKFKQGMQKPANVHYSPEGSDALADSVVESITTALKARSKK